MLTFLTKYFLTVLKKRSWHVEKSQTQSWLVSTVETPRLNKKTILEGWGSRFVLIVSRSRVSISTLSRCLSWQSKKSWHFKKFDLDNWNWEVLTWPSLKLKSLDFKNLNREKKIWSQHNEQSRQVSKVGIDTKNNRDLDPNWSRLPRLPGLPKRQFWLP